MNDEFEELANGLAQSVRRRGALKKFGLDTIGVTLLAILCGLPSVRAAPTNTAPASGVAMWTNRYNGPGNGDDWANAVAVDGSGNGIVTGFSGARESGFDYATIKYSSAGVALWTNRYNGPWNLHDLAQAIAVDGNGNIFVTGISRDAFATTCGIVDQPLQRPGQRQRFAIIQVLPCYRAGRLGLHHRQVGWRLHGQL